MTELKVYDPYRIAVCKAGWKSGCCKYLVQKGNQFACSKLAPAPAGFIQLPEARGDNCQGVADLERIERSIAICDDIHFNLKVIDVSTQKHS